MSLATSGILVDSGDRLGPDAGGEEPNGLSTICDEDDWHPTRVKSISIRIELDGTSDISTPFDNHWRALVC